MAEICPPVENFELSHRNVGRAWGFIASLKGQFCQNDWKLLDRAQEWPWAAMAYFLAEMSASAPPEIGEHIFNVVLINWTIGALICGFAVKITFFRRDFSVLESRLKRCSLITIHDHVSFKKVA